MIHDLIALLPYSCGIFLAIILPAVLIARQEICTEGLFGWQSLTFTKRYPPNSLISKVVRWVVGQDKWATEYHLVSMSIWLLIYATPIVFVLVYAKLAGASALSSTIGVMTLAFASLLLLSVSEDYIWFLVHPYYGPQRHNPDFVYWFQSFKGGIPTTYWAGMFLTVILVGAMALLLRRLELLEIWLMTLTLVSLFCFVFLRQWAKKPLDCLYEYAGGKVLR